MATIIEEQNKRIDQLIFRANATAILLTAVLQVLNRHGPQFKAEVIETLERTPASDAAEQSEIDEALQFIRRL